MMLMMTLVLDVRAICKHQVQKETDAEGEEEV